ncbi:DNA topoisomerase IV subunit A [Rhodocyclus purpureus]|uniref:DNA topoisomerase IV subunit A n=1 Tax=Rhodocyclus purpureus TaxID=1067 RepID=UPI001F5D8F5C|nr:DNA topoisomerase IV subunit A [Rhodocyclus purpureus]
MSTLPEEQQREGVPIGSFAERAYLAYAIMAVKDRAIPMVHDGQKPVQKRILYSMWEAGQKSDAKPVKSARVVGDVLGKLHPHGDTAVYDAMVRLAQDFTVRYPLMDGQGNFGSLDGDTAAAMRYTEIRLAPIAELLLAEVGLGTVDFQDNYDGSFQEPKVLPARLPFTLLNGASGIAVGMACDLPPHNLREVAAACVAQIRNPDLTTDELMQHLPGPDFPGGGKLISPAADIRSAYESGQGSLRVRARYEVEELARNQWQVVITEFPPGCSAKKVLEELDALADPKLKDPKKDKLKPQQVAARQRVLSLIDNARDESDKSTAVRLVIEPKTSKVNRDELMAFLFSATSLESSVKVNLTVVGLDGNPCRKSVKMLIAEWADFRFTTVTRRCRHRLDEVDRRLHILEGRKIALLHIDEVIRIIRESDEPKSALMNAFGLSEVQAQDILEIRLRQLARLEWIKLEKEVAELTKEKAKLEKLLGSDKAMREAIVKEIEADAARFGDDRRTLIEEEAVASSSLPVAAVADEPVTVILSKNGWLRAAKGHGLDLAQLAFKPGDALLAAVETRSVLPVVLLDSAGRAYSFMASEAPTGRGDGVPITTLIEIQNGARLLHLLSADPESRYLFAGQGGYGFVSALKNLVARPRSGKTFLTLEEGEAPLPPLALPADTRGLWIGGSTSAGRFAVFPFVELRELDKGKGVKLVGLDPGAQLACLLPVVGDKLVLQLDIRGRVMPLTLAGDELEQHRVHRGAKGSHLPKNGIVVGVGPVKR